MTRSRFGKRALGGSPARSVDDTLKDKATLRQNAIVAAKTLETAVDL